MADKKPVVDYSGQRSNIQSGDNLVVAGKVSSSQVFMSSGTDIILAPTTGGSAVYLRPSAWNSSTGEAILYNTGEFVLSYLYLKSLPPPSVVLDGHIWYNAADGKIKKREGGVTTDIGTSSGGSGTVTSIPDGSTNGVNWSVSLRSTTPTFNFTLGNITPDSVTVLTDWSFTRSGGVNWIQTTGAFDSYRIGWTSQDWLTISANSVQRNTSPTAGSNNTEVATMANVRAAGSFAVYRTVLDSSGSHTAARVAGTYGFGQGDPLAISGTGTLYPLNTIYIDSADYPSVDGLSPKLRLRGQVYCNDVAATGTYIIGLYPITRPGTSGAAGLNIYTLGTVVSGSQTGTLSAPAADSMNNLVGSDFALPANGHYVIGMVQTGTVAASSHLHFSASLQMRYA